jgi:hypothetical protein
MSAFIVRVPEPRSKSSPSPSRSVLASGVLTGIAALVLAGSAAGAGALLAHHFGRTARTDGFLAAYGVYVVLALAAQSFRLVVSPELTRAAAAGSLGAELRAYVLAFLVLGAPASVLVGVFSRPLGDALTGSLPHEAAVEAGQALVWLVPAAFGQLGAALCAGALAARDSYGVAAAAYSAGGLSGLVLFALLAGSHGLVSLAWGLALNAAVTLAVPLAVLALRGEWGGARARLDVHHRLWRLVEGAAVPIALQGFYVVALRLASGLGVGRVTSLSYAYLLAATLVTATAFSLGIVSSAPLTRRGLDPRAAAEHVVHGSWVSLALVGAAAGVFALVGGRIVSAVLGGPYREVGRLVVDLSPWMIGFAAYSLTFPLVFVAGARRLLVPIALAGLAVDVPVGIGLRALGGMTGIAAGLAVATFAVIAGLALAISPRMLAPAAAGLSRQAALVGGSAALAFGGLALLVGPIPAAAAGLAAYGLLLLVLREHGLGEALAYVRALH